MRSRQTSIQNRVWPAPGDGWEFGRSIVAILLALSFASGPAGPVGAVRAQGAALPDVPKVSAKAVY